MILYLDEKQYVNTSIFFDASIGLSNTNENPRAWYVDFPIIEPVQTESFIGSVAAGNSVNFRNISFNPHGHGTHIECLGHVTKEVFSVNQLFKEYFLTARLITITPEKVFNTHFQEEDLVITKESLEKVLTENTECLLIRTLPNPLEKKTRNYSNSNFPYLAKECVETLNKYGVKHLIVDLPSVDREVDNGVLDFHKTFWNVNTSSPSYDKTITEFAYFSEEIKDGTYLLNMQVAPIENDASPCRPLLFPIFFKT